MSKVLDSINGISKAELIALDLRKGKGEGSRGGNVVGHTKSGKPIYQSHHHNDIHGQKRAHAEKHGNFDQHYRDYKPSDHIDAQFHHLEHSRKHHEAAESLRKEGKHEESQAHRAAGDYHHGQVQAHSHAKLVKLNASTRSSASHDVHDLKAAQHALKMDKKLPKGMSQAAQDELRRAELIALDLRKGKGEGTRGGNVIGHTPSGHPIYAPKTPHASTHGMHRRYDHEDHGAKHASQNSDTKDKHWTPQDHLHAAKEHNSLAHHHDEKAWSLPRGSKERDHHHAVAHSHFGAVDFHARVAAGQTRGTASERSTKKSMTSQVEKGATMYDDKISKNLAEVKKLVDSGKKVDDAVRAAYPDYSDEEVLAAVRAYGKMYTDPKQPDLVRSVDAIHNYSDEILAFYRR